MSLIAMMKTTIVLIMTIALVHSQYNCPTSNEIAVNDDDYRSYFACENYCDRLKYCSGPTEYFSGAERTCKSESLDWSPAYNLTGSQQVIPFVQSRHIRQTGYDVHWLSETRTRKFTFVGRYINQTHVMGTETILLLHNNCVLVQDVLLWVKQTRSLSIRYQTNPYSMNCEFPSTYLVSSDVKY